MLQRARTTVALIVLLVVAGGCGAHGASNPATGAAPAVPGGIDSIQITQPVELLFWHRQAGDSEVLQQKLIDEFTASNPNIRIRAESLGDYDKLYQKTLSSIQAGAAPDLVAAYESQAAEYFEAGALVPFDDFVHSQKYGLTDEQLRDYIPSFMSAT